MLVNVSEGDKVDSLLTLKRKTDVNGRPCMNKWCPETESNPWVEQWGTLLS